jgi:hypothetical protein
VARTYAKNGRITINTIIRVAAHHLVQGNTDLCTRALDELIQANNTTFDHICNIHKTITALNTGKHPKEQITKELQINKIKWM